MTRQKHKFHVNDEVWILYHGTKLEPLNMKGRITRYASVKSSKYGNKILRLGYYEVDVNGVKHVIHESRMKKTTEKVSFT